MNRLNAAQSTLLDALRGLSALMVMMGHALVLLPNPPAISTDYPIHSYGVIVFFALSGFLIVYSCLTRDAHSFNDYMIDRFARIYTCFGPALLCVALIDVLVLDRFRLFGDRISLTTFVANLVMLHRTQFDRLLAGLPFIPSFGSAQQFWTIAVEWWLYVLFGITFFIRRSSQAERLAMALLVVPASVVVLYFCTHETIGLVWVFCGFGAVAFCNFLPSRRLAGLSLFAAVFFAVALAMRLQVVNAKVSFDLTFMVLIIGLFFSLLALVREGYAFAAVLNWSRPLWAWLSSISYSLYLTHLTLMFVYADLFGIRGLRDVLVLCLASVAVGALFTFLFDRHHRAVAKRLKSLQVSCWRAPARADKPINQPLSSV